MVPPPPAVCMRGWLERLCMACVFFFCCADPGGLNNHVVSCPDPNALPVRGITFRAAVGIGEFFVEGLRKTPIITCTYTKLIEWSTAGPRMLGSVEWLQRVGCNFVPHQT